MAQELISPVEMIKVLKGRDYELASNFIKAAASLNCTSAIRYATAHRTWKCVYSKRKPKRVLFTIECNEERWSIKANLFHIDKYRQLVESCPESIKGRIKSAYDCRNCSSYCKGGTQFTLDGVHYTKCIGCCFYFSEMDDNDWSIVEELIVNESKF